MTATTVLAAPRPAPRDNGGNGNGGLPARRVVTRWAWRLFTREWRQQVLILLLLTFAVGIAVFGATAAYNLPSVRAAQFGTANQFMQYRGADRALRAELAAAKHAFGTIDTIGHRSVAVPGSVETIDVRSQDPRGAYGAPMLALRSGRYPTRADEVAVTDAVAQLLDTHVGATVELGARHSTVVGLVENPNDFSDEFALESPSPADPPQSVTVLFRATPAQFDTFRSGNRSPMMRASSGQDEKATAAIVALAVATVMLVLVAFVAAAGFVVVAQRRQRQLGMLAAIGATERHLRLVMLANGAVVGVIAAVVGAAIGLAVRIAFTPALETAAGHRIGRFDLPWWVVGASMLLAVVTATAAAWLPARNIARLSITQALSARPTRVKPARRSAMAAGLFIAIGATCLARAHERTALLIIGGTLAIAFGVLFLGPLAIRALAACGARLPVVPRLALRDLVRYQARSAAALAAISLSVGIASAVVIAAAPAPVKANAGNLPTDQLIVRIADARGPAAGPVPSRTPAQIANLSAAVDRLAAALGHPALVPLDVAVDASVEPMTPLPSGSGIAAPPGGGEGGWPAVMLARGAGPSHNDGDLVVVYVATPALLAHVGVDFPTDPRADALLSRPAAHRMEFVAIAARGVDAKTQTIHVAGAAYSSLPTSFLTPASIARHGWKTLRAGWLIDASRAFTAAQLTAARHAAAEVGLSIEARRIPPSNSGLRTGATAVGALVALVVLALTIGLIRGEATGDLRTLSAIGATSVVRRTLTASTAAALALLGVILGTFGAYVALASGYAGHLDRLQNVPVAHLAFTFVGVPVIAAIGGWLLAVREAPSVSTD